MQLTPIYTIDDYIILVLRDRIIQPTHRQIVDRMDDIRDDYWKNDAQFWEELFDELKFYYN